MVDTANYFRQNYFMSKRKKSKDSSSLSFTGLKVHPQLKTNACYCIVKVATRMRARLDERLEPFNIIGPQYAILRLLSIEGRMTQIELGNFMAMDKATMVRMIDALEQRAYVSRTQNAADRRAKFLELTSGGKKVLSKLDDMREETEAEFFAPLTAAEKKQLKEIVSKLLA
jgi:DNA-binding MarR family transcriptional regulator